MTTSFSAGNKNTNGETITYLEFERPLAKLEKQLEELESTQALSGRDHSDTIKVVRAELASMRNKLYTNLDAWETVQMARHPKRPLVPDYINMHRIFLGRTVETALNTKLAGGSTTINPNWREEAENLDPALMRLIKDCCQHEREDRPQNMKLVKDRLEMTFDRLSKTA